MRITPILRPTPSNLGQSPIIWLLLRTTFSVLVLILSLPSLLFAADFFEGRVVQVKDGDTIVISPGEGERYIICRIYGIDAPEGAKKGKVGQPYGEDATKELKRLVLGITVEVEGRGKDRYGRSICVIRSNGQDIGLEIVKRGYAWAYVQYLKRPHASEYIEAEKEARSKRLGLWQDYNPIPPWEFRKSRYPIHTTFGVPLRTLSVVVLRVTEPDLRYVVVFCFPPSIVVFVVTTGLSCTFFEILPICSDSFM